MEEDGLPHGELDDAHGGVEHVVDHLGQLVSPIGQERALWPAQQIEDTVPKTKEPKCDSEVYSKPSWFNTQIMIIIINNWHYVWPKTDPVKGIEAPGSLEVVRKDEIVKKGDGEPDEVGAEEKELAGDERNPPTRGRHCCLLCGQETLKPPSSLDVAPWCFLKVGGMGMGGWGEGDV